MKYQIVTTAIAGAIGLTGCAPAGQPAQFANSSSAASTPVSASVPSTSPNTPPSTTGSGSSGSGTGSSGTSPSMGTTAGTTAPPTVTARPSTAANLKSCPGAATLNGIDLSNYDVGTVWSTVAHSGAGFAYLKATEGSNYTSPQFSGDWAGSKANGIYRGAYHFYHPADNPSLQASYYLSVVGQMGANDLPPMLDWEVTDGQTNAVQIQNALIWLQAVEAATGKVPIIYTGWAFFNALGNPVQFAKYPLYIANYGVTCPDIPPPWSNWVFWQTGIGTVPGVQATQVDVDVFNGTLAQLAAFANTGSL